MIYLFFILIVIYFPLFYFLIKELNKRESKLNLNPFMENRARLVIRKYKDGRNYELIGSYLSNDNELLERLEENCSYNKTGWQNYQFFELDFKTMKFKEVKESLREE